MTESAIGNVAIIGLGNMGYGMAMNARKRLPAEAVLHIYDINREALAKFKAEAGGNISIADSAYDAASKADTVVTMLPTGKHVKDVYLTGPNALVKLPHGSARKLFLDCGTIDTATSKEVSEAIAASGLGDFADTPVSGGKRGANAGTLSFMIGCEPALFPRLKAAASLMGTPENILHSGPPTSGLACKIINNYLFSVHLLAAAEAMNMGEHYGLDPTTLNTLVNVSSGMSWATKNVNPDRRVHPESSPYSGYENGFPIELMTKDVMLAVDGAKEIGAKLVLGEEVAKVYQGTREDSRFKGKDCRNIYRWLGADV